MLKREEIYNYDLFALIYGRDHHNIVKQLSFNKQTTNKQCNLKMGRRPEWTFFPKKTYRWLTGR